MSNELKNIVIVGLSSSIHVVKELEKQLKGNETYRLIVIEANEFGYYPPAALRASVVPGWENEVLVGLDKLFDDSSRHILMNKTKVISINENNVVVDNNSRIEEYTDNVIPYDILILATGSTYTMPCRPNNNTTEGIKSNLRKLQSEIKDSENIVIIGGGALGIEFAGEVQSYHHKRKNVKLIHSNDTLVDKEVGVHNTVLSQLHDLNIEVLLDDRVENIRDLSFGKCPEQVVKTKSGKEIKADFILNATGTKPNISLVENFDNSLISDKKLIKVKPTLQIDSPKLERVFAMGDIVNIDDLKTFVNAKRHTSIVSNNVMCLVNDNQTFSQYSVGPTIMVISVGPKGGAFRLGWIHLGAWAARIKSKSLFVNQFKSPFT